MGINREERGVYRPECMSSGIPDDREHRLRKTEEPDRFVERLIQFHLPAPSLLAFDWLAGEFVIKGSDRGSLLAEDVFSVLGYSKSHG